MAVQTQSLHRRIVLASSLRKKYSNISAVFCPVEMWNSSPGSFFSLACMLMGALRLFGRSHSGKRNAFYEFVPFCGLSQTATLLHNGAVALVALSRVQNDFLFQD